MQQGDVLDNRYQVLRPVGSGGMGSVWLVHDLERNRDCALKVLDDQGMGASPAIKQEFEALSALEHAGVVEVYELHENFYTMEFIEGKTLDALEGDNVFRILDLACELCQILSYIHSQGVIHRDLKPENVLVTPTERMVVMDFGLAMTRMRGGAKIAGTVHYMAPEQLKGYAIDPRADLYSVGVILYQLTTTRLPFDEADLMSAVMDHIKTDPPPPRRYNRELPEQFEALILRAMAKDPVDRFQTAEEMLDELRMLGGRSEIRQMRVEKGARILMEPSFVGREPEMAQLDAAWDLTVARRRPGLTLVAGPRGTGCSRLVTEFAGRKLSIDQVFLEVDLSERHDGPLGALSTLVAAVARQVERLAPELAERLNAIYGTLLLSAAPTLAQESAALRDFGEARITPAELREVLVDYLTAVAEVLPTAVLVHDLERLPKPMADTLVALLTACADLPIWVCGTVADRKAAGPWRSLLELGLGAGARTDIELDEMSDGELTRILASMVGRKRLDVDEYSGLLRMCLGRAGLAVELFRDLADAGQIYRKGSLWVLEIADITRIPRPELLEEALTQQVGSVSKAGRRLLAVASMAEGRLPIAACAEVGGLNPDQARKATGELVRGAYLLTGEDGSQLMPYRTLGAKLVRELGEKRRARIHTELAERMEQVLEGHPDDHRRIAEHYRAAGAPDRALDNYLRAGEGAKSRQEPAVALDCYDAARALAAEVRDNDKLVDALGQMASLHSRAGDYPRAVELYREALQRLGEDGAARHQLFFRAGLGFALTKLRMLDDAKKLFEMLLRAAPRVPENYLHLGRVELSRGDIDAAEEQLRQGLDIARARGEVRTRAALYHVLGWVHYLKGMLPTAANFYSRAIDMLGERDLHLRAQISTSFAIWHLTGMSDPRKAYKYVEDTLYLAELTGDVDRQISGTLLAGQAFELDGDLRKALRLYHRASHMAHENNRHAAAGKAHLAIARAAIKQEDPETATRYLSRAIKIFKELEYDWGTAASYHRLAEALLQQGDVDKAFHVLGRAERRYKSANLRWMLPRVYALVADVHLARGDVDNALKLLNKTLPRAKSVRDNLGSGMLYRRYGRACELAGKQVQANEHYRASRTALGRTGDVIALADTDLETARYLLDEERRGERGHLKRARRLLERTIATYNSAGATRTAQRASRLLDEVTRTANAQSLEGILAEADIDGTLDDLRGETRSTLADLASELTGMDGTMTNDLVARFEAKLKDAESTLDKKIDALRQRNAYLLEQLEELKRERQNMVTLQEINAQISSELDSDKMLGMILDTALELVGAERGFIMMLDEEGVEPVFKAARNLDKEQIEDPRAGLSSTIVKKVIRTREPLLTSDAQADGRFEGQSIQELRLKSLMCTPLESKGKVIGALYVDNRSASDLFSEQDLDFMIAFSNQAALALENALLHEEYRKKERLEQELNIAAKIQQSLLPTSNPTLPGMEVYGRMIPAGHLGGDYFDFIDTDDGGLTICIGDVSGKGVPASLVMVMARLILHHLSGRVVDTQEALVEANRILHTNTEPFVFMSMLLLHWDKQQRTIRYTGAGHETLMVYRAAADEVEVIPAGGVVLGIKNDVSSLIEEKSLALAPGDVVLLYTDGVTEAHDPNGDMYQVERLQQALKECAEGTAELIVDALFEELLEFMSDAEQHDDITITVLRRTQD